MTRANIGPEDRLQPLGETASQHQRQQLLELIRSESVSDNVRVLANDSLYWLRCEANLAEGELRWGDAAQLLKRLTEAGPEQWRFHHRLGDVLGRLGRYREAADALFRARNLGGERLMGDPVWWHQVGLALSASGDREGHRTLCREMMVHYGADGPDPLAQLKSEDVRDIVQVCVAGTRLLDGWQRLLDKVRTDKDDLSIALLLARAGRFGEAKDHLEKVEGDDGATFGEALRAIVHQRLGHLDEARNHLKSDRSTIRDFGKGYLYWSAWDSGFAGWTWEDMLSLKLLTHEAELLIEGNDSGYTADPFVRP